MTTKTCRIEGCTSAQVHKELCGRHYKHHRRAVRKHPDDKCSVGDCPRPIEARFMCNRHYQRWQKTGDALKTVNGARSETGMCEVQFCMNPHFGKGMCFTHYNQRNDVKERKATWRRSLEARYRCAVSQAQRQGREWTISFDDWSEIVAKPCHYRCGNLLPDTGYALDRIDNAHGYHLNNVIPCCTSCNRTRRADYTVEEMEVMIAALVEYRRSKRESA